MTIKQALIDEIEVLLQFNISTTLEGIKIHHDARPGLVEAAESLYKKGLISRHDGGYLTDLGHETAEHLQKAITIILS